MNKKTAKQDVGWASTTGKALAESGFRRAFYITAAEAGLKIIPDDKCCRLLAWLYGYDGENEQVSEVSDTIFYAQCRLNLFSEEQPNPALLPILLGYLKDRAGGDFDIDKYNNPPAWVIDLEKEYGLKPHREKPHRKEE
jgi:hypothetical protein